MTFGLLSNRETTDAVENNRDIQAIEIIKTSWHHPTLYSLRRTKPGKGRKLFYYTESSIRINMTPISKNSNILLKKIEKKLLKYVDCYRRLTKTIWKYII